MPEPRNIRERSLSQKTYERLLLAYPRAHREQFGSAMAQLFRDQHRDAVRESRSWGVVKLWLRTLPDLLNTSIAERLSALNPKKSMSDKVTALIRPATPPLVSFILAFFIVFFLVLITSVAITFLLPESYASTARIKVEPDQTTDSKQMSYDPYFIQTTFEVIQSQMVLDQVIDKLDLNTRWGKKYFGGKTLKSAETLELLKARLQLTPVRNTTLIAITAYSDDPNEAARIANAVAESYRDYRIKQRAEFINQAIAVLQNAYQQEESRIQETQSDVESLGRKFNVPDLDALTPDEFAQHFEKQQEDGQRDYKYLSIQLNTLKTLKKDQLPDVLPNIVNDQTLSELINQRHAAEQSFASLTNSYSLTNPKVVEVQSMENTLDRQINDRVTGILAGMEAQVNAKRAALDSLAAKVQSVKDAKPYWDKKRELQQMRDNHRLLYAKIQTEKIEAQIPKVQVQITDQAEPGSRPVRPNKTLDIFIGAVAGGFLGLLAGGVACLLSVGLGKRRAKSMSPA